MTTFMPPPPAATFLAFHPQDNNIIAIGMDDSTIQIYNVRIDEVLAPAITWLRLFFSVVNKVHSDKMYSFFVQVKSKLRGHSKKITGLAFSNVLNVLVSSGADAQVFTELSSQIMSIKQVLFHLQFLIVPVVDMCLEHWWVGEAKEQIFADTIWPPNV